MSETNSEDSFRRPTLVETVNFFDIIGDIPSWDKLSVDESFKSVVAKDEKEVKEDYIEDESNIKENVDKETDEVEAIEGVADDEEESEITEEEYSEESDDTDDLAELDKKLMPPPPMTKEIELELPIKDDMHIEQDLAMTIAKEAHERVVEQTMLFLEEIITQTVTTCEYVDPSEILRSRLDRDKLMEEINQKLAALEYEQRIRFFLNRKVVEHFKRKKRMRPLTEDSPQTLISQINKFRENTKMLDIALEKEKETIKLIETNLANVEKQVEDKKAEAEKLEENLNNLIRVTFLPDSVLLSIAPTEKTDDHPNKSTTEVVAEKKLATVIRSLLGKMAAMRNDISEVRYVMIQRQHTMASLTEKASQLEDLGDGLRMIEFEHLQTETAGIGKKIEERNNELNRLRTRCHSDTHTLAHIREKKKMIRNTIEQQENILKELQDERQSCRQYLHELKIKRGNIRQETLDISYQGGLIGKPELLLDFDETTESVKKMEEQVSSLRNHYQNISEKLQNLTKFLEFS